MARGGAATRRGGELIAPFWRRQKRAPPIPGVCVPRPRIRIAYPLEVRDTSKGTHALNEHAMTVKTMGNDNAWSVITPIGALALVSVAAVRARAPRWQ
jgi:hypothetical protein